MLQYAVLSYKTLLLGLSLLVLNACAVISLDRSFKDETEVIATYGQPIERWNNNDGTTTLEYSTQPNGTICLMIQVDSQGHILRQWDALSPENRAKVTPGMDKEAILRLLGHYRTIQHFSLSGEEVWDWNIFNDGPGIATRFNVHFINGKVVRTSQSYEFVRRYFRYGFWHPPMWHAPFSFYCY